MKLRNEQKYLLKMLINMIYLNEKGNVGGQEVPNGLKNSQGEGSYLSIIKQFDQYININKK